MRRKETDTAPPKGSATSKSKPGAKRQKKSATDVEAEIAGLREQLAEAIVAQQKAEEATTAANKARDEAEAARANLELRSKSTELNASLPKIQKPKASGMSEGNGRLRKAMGLQDDKTTYLAIQSTVRDLVHQVRLDLRVEYRQQPAKDLGDLFKMARHLQPYLRRFQNDWATAELAKQYLSNRRKSEARKRKLPDTQVRAGKRRHIDELDSVHSKEDSENENEGEGEDD